MVCLWVGKGVSHTPTPIPDLIRDLDDRKSDLNSLENRRGVWTNKEILTWHNGVSIA